MQARIRKRERALAVLPPVRVMPLLPTCALRASPARTRSATSTRLLNRLLHRNAENPRPAMNRLFLRTCQPRLDAVGGGECRFAVVASRMPEDPFVVAGVVDRADLLADVPRAVARLAEREVLEPGDHATGVLDAVGTLAGVCECRFDDLVG